MKPTVITSGSVFGSTVSIALKCATPGSTIYYKVLAYGSATPAENAPGNGWIVYTAGFVLSGSAKTLYAYATLAGYTASDLTRFDWSAGHHL